MSLLFCKDITYRQKKPAQKSTVSSEVLVTKSLNDKELQNSNFVKESERSGREQQPTAKDSESKVKDQYPLVRYTEVNSHRPDYILTIPYRLADKFNFPQHINIRVPLNNPTT